MSEMTWFGRGGPSVLGAILGTFGCTIAFAAEPTCPTLAVQADDSLLARWPALPERIRQTLEGRDDIDACARIELTRQGRSTIGVTVVLRDGRSASRSTPDEDVLPTLEALLLVPMVDGMAATVAPSAASVAPTAPAATAQAPLSDAVRVDAREPRHDEASREMRMLASPEGHLRIELSVMADARVGNGQTGLGMGAVSLVDVGGWLAGFEGRADRYQPPAGVPGETSLELAALFGRRFRSRNVDVDLLAGPAIALQRGAGGTAVAPGGSMTPPSDGEVAPRALVGARLNFFAHSMLGWFVGLDGELGPSGASAASNPPGLPVWTAGLALGATVGTR
jgi:hypothetical protein